MQNIRIKYDTFHSNGIWSLASWNQDYISFSYGGNLRFLQSTVESYRSHTCRMQVIINNGVFNRNKSFIFHQYSMKKDISTLL